MSKFSFKTLFALRTIKRLLCLLFVYGIIIYIIHRRVWKGTLMEYFSMENIKWLGVWKEDSERNSSVQFTADFHTEDRNSGDDDLELKVIGKDGMPTVAIGSGITSTNQTNLSISELPTQFLLFSKFFPSFCKTASSGFLYHFYLAFDATDEFFRNPEFLAKFIATFGNITSSLCLHLGTVSLHMVKCNHTGKPAWAQNDAMLEAYLDNVDYFYRINDDTVMQTDNWTQIFVDVLNGLDPPNVGVVGPNHAGGNVKILTYDFVHRTHIDIFGFYYPRIFTDWFADGWITRTYKPTRCIKVSNIHLDHTTILGRRYNVDVNKKDLQAPRVKNDQVLLSRFVSYTRANDTIAEDGKKVVSMSLYGSDPKYTWGAIRNAQIAPIFFPGWKLRFYLTSRSSKAADVKSWLVSKRIVNKLKQLGAEIAYVKTKSIAPVFWRYLVIDDQTVDYFIVRDTDSRLSDRDAAAVNDWLHHQDLKSDLNSLHCIRDHPDHANRSIVEGLWGGNRKTIQRMLLREEVSHNSNVFWSARNKSTHASSALTIELLMSRKSFDSVGFLSGLLWSLLSSNAYCHDSVSCDKWKNSKKFPAKRNNDEYLGQEFDAHQEPVKTDSDWIERIGIGCSHK